MKHTLYFAYGSNLNEEQMVHRCPGAVAFRRATLKGYRLAFGGHSQTWGGSVATLKKNKKHSVPGVLYWLPREEMKILDRYEGHPWCYHRKLLYVTDEMGIGWRGYVYVMPVKNEAPPSVSYFHRICCAYQTLGFDLKPLLSMKGGAR